MSVNLNPTRIIHVLTHVLLVSLILVSIIGGISGALTTLGDGQYILLDTTINVLNTTADYYELSYNPLTQQFTLKYMYSANTTLVLQTNMSLDAGDALAPHLYTWYFDGVDDYVSVTFSTTPFTTSSNLTMIERIYYLRRYTGNWGTLWKLIASNDWAFELYTQASLVYVTKLNDSSSQHTYFNVALPSAFTDVAFVASDKYYLYVNGQQASTKDRPSEINYNVTGIRIGSESNAKNFISAYISYVLAYNRALSPSEINTTYTSKIISANGLALFLDPTFYDGNKYIDLSRNNNYGIPYNGVTRIPDGNAWIYTVKGLYNDGYVHLRYFPIGSIVRFRDPVTNSIVYSVTIDRDDVVVNIRGNYIVEAIVQYPAGATIQGLPPYINVIIDGSTVVTVPEEGHVTIPPGTHRVQIVAKSATYTSKDLAVRYDKASGLVTIYTPLHSSVLVYTYDIYRQLHTIASTVTTVDRAQLYMSGVVILPVVMTSDYQGNLQMIRSTRHLILANTSFYLPAYGTYINTSTVVKVANIALNDTALVLDDKSISVSNANLVINSWLDSGSSIWLTADAPTGTVSYIYIRNIDRPLSVTVKHPDSTTTFNAFLTGDINQLYLWNGDAVYYDANTRLLAIKIIHHSPADVEIAFNPLAPAAVGADIANMISLHLASIIQVLMVALPGIMIAIVLVLVIKSVKGIAE